MRYVVLVVLGGFGSLSGLRAPLYGQSVADWSDFRPCVRCDLTAERILALGDQVGPGSIESDGVVLTGRRGHGFIIHALPGQALSLFDERGRLLRSIGREGQGPGEFEAIMSAAYTDRGTIVALGHSGRWTAFTRDGRLLGETRLSGVGQGPFQLEVGDSTVLVARIDRRPEAFGFPLHRVDLATGAVVARLGAKDPVQGSLAEPWSTSVLIGREERIGPSVWWGKMGRPHLEEWSVDGSPLRVLTGELAWFPPMTREGPRGGGPWNLMKDFAVDDQDRLWLVTLVADRRWREARRGPEGGIPPADRDTFWDARLDLFDLRGMRHVGFHIFDPAEVKLLKRSGKVFAYFVEYETPTWPRVVLYRIDSPPAQPRR